MGLAEIDAKKSSTAQHHHEPREQGKRGTLGKDRAPTDATSRADDQRHTRLASGNGSTFGLAKSARPRAFMGKNLNAYSFMLASQDSIVLKKAWLMNELSRLARPPPAIPTSSPDSPSLFFFSSFGRSLTLHFTFCLFTCTLLRTVSPRRDEKVPCRPGSLQRREKKKGHHFLIKQGTWAVTFFGGRQSEKKNPPRCTGEKK